MSRRQSIVLRFVGLVLLAAAGLKLYGWKVDPVAQSGWLSLPWVQLLVIQFEIALGVSLLSGWLRTAAWAATLATFTAFTAFSLHAALVGQASCGCFGRIALSPWITFAIDLAVLFLLACSTRKVRETFDCKFFVVPVTLEPICYCP